MHFLKKTIPCEYMVNLIVMHVDIEIGLGSLYPTWLSQLIVTNAPTHLVSFVVEHV